MLETINNYGDRVIDYDKQDFINALIRYGSIDKAAHILNVHVETIRKNIPDNTYGKYLRQPAIITSEFNEYVMRPW